MKGPTDVMLTTPFLPIKNPASVLMVYEMSAVIYSCIQTKSSIKFVLNYFGYEGQKTGMTAIGNAGHLSVNSSVALLQGD